MMVGGRLWSIVMASTIGRNVVGCPAKRQATDLVGRKQRQPPWLINGFAYIGIGSHLSSNQPSGASETAGQQRDRL